MTHHARRALPAAVAALALLLAGCGGDGEAEARPTVDGTVLQPGSPGEPVEELDEAPRIEAAQATDADVRFAQMMIPHHAQALEMSELAPRAGGSRKVKILADRISGAQGPEIVYMAGWLTDQGHDAPTKKQIESGDIPMEHGHGAHGSGDGQMAGMATPSQMDALANARGTDFDTIFLQLMIRHHRGAVEMAGDVLRDGAEQRLNELASGVAADQTAEIARMTDILEKLS